VTDRSLMLARVSLLFAGSMLLLETLLGCIYVLGIGFSTTKNIILDLCLTLAFPIYLFCLVSLRTAAVGLWVFFAVQSIDICFNQKPTGFVNPLGWAHGDLLFAAAILVSLSIWMISRVKGGAGPATLSDVLNATKAGGQRTL
jgi:hypothetical protein